VKIKWTPEAVQDRTDIWNFIAADSPRAAAKIDALFSKTVAKLSRYPKLGKSGIVDETRELIVHENYRLVYEIIHDTIWILALVHVTQQWPPLKR
jgi:toxin ParE1/3/4